MGCQSIVAKDICITNVMGYVKKKERKSSDNYIYLHNQIGLGVW